MLLYLRVTAARAAREHPVSLRMLADGRLHLSAIARLAPHLTAENGHAVLQRAVHRSKREILELVAELAPRPDGVPSIRRLPEPRTPAATGRSPIGRADRRRLCPDRVVGHLLPDGARAEAVPGRVHPPSIEPTSSGRYRVQFTASSELRGKLERLQALMRSAVPDGELAAIIDAAVTEMLARLEARRFALTDQPRSSLAANNGAGGSRRVPAAVRRAVSEREQGQCAYRDANGRRCSAREGLEFHHRRPYGFGGEHSVDNVALLCRAHNAYLAEIDYGRRAEGVRPTTASASAPPVG